jgi:hypothetical protein
MSEPEQPNRDEPASFSSLVLMLGTAALVHLGASPDPGQEEPQRDLGEARRLIDWLGILKDKTEERLSPEERMLLEHLLFDLRMRYLAAERKA